MRLYHGSDVEVVSPQLRESRRALDFGEGFYVTSSFDQACKWAISVCGRRGTRSATVSVYEFDTSVLEWLDVLGSLRWTLTGLSLLPQTGSRRIAAAYSTSQSSL